MEYKAAIYAYIEKLWKESKMSKRQFALKYNIDERTLRDILNNNSTYQISLPTIYRICEVRNIMVSEFFSAVEDEFPEVKIKK